jgi:hypothetical protein
MTIDEAVFKVMDGVSSDDLGKLGAIFSNLINSASRYFIECPDDFCVQTIGYQSIVFGGTNRLIWIPEFGFRPDPQYCTESFLRRCASLGDLPRGQ